MRAAYNSSAEGSMKAYIFTGVQASGKSSFYEQRLSDIKRISLDILKTRHREKTAFNEAILSGEDIVIDNTNPTVADRQRYIVPAKAAGYRIIGYYFSSKISDCIARNRLREGDRRVPDTAVAHTFRIMELPDLSEGFDELYYVSMNENGFAVSEWKKEE